MKPGPFMLFGCVVKKVRRWHDCGSASQVARRVEIIALNVNGINLPIKSNPGGWKGVERAGINGLRLHKCVLVTLTTCP